MQTVSERIASYGAQSVSDEDLVRALLGRPITGVSMAKMASGTITELEAEGFTPAMAQRLVVAFELGRRAGWPVPKRGERCLDPETIHGLMRDVAHADTESFWIVMLDVRGRLIRRHAVAKGSVAQCPVAPRDVFVAPLKEGAHSVVLVHNHPSGDPAPSVEDVDLTHRLRSGAELLGIVCRDHVIVAAGGYFSFVEAGRWSR